MTLQDGEAELPGTLPVVFPPTLKLSVQCIKTAFVNPCVWHHCSVIGYCSVSVLQCVSTVICVSDWQQQGPAYLAWVLTRQTPCMASHTLIKTHTHTHMLYIHPHPKHTPTFRITENFPNFCPVNIHFFSLLTSSHSCDITLTICIVGDVEGRNMESSH